MWLFQEAWTELVLDETILLLTAHTPFRKVRGILLVKRRLFRKCHFPFTWDENRRPRDPPDGVIDEGLWLERKEEETSATKDHELDVVSLEMGSGVVGKTEGWADSVAKPDRYSMWPSEWKNLNVTYFISPIPTMWLILSHWHHQCSMI